jgi:2-phosphosulfolactate phosphatase
VRLDVYFTPSELAGLELPDHVVVIDVLRATSTMVEALDQGAKAIVPVETADEAVRMAQNIGRDSVRLCGERKGLPIDGFDLGNAPGEFTSDQVRDMTLVMTTTNGTRAVLAVAERQGAAAEDGPVTILAGSYLNLSAVTDRLATSGAKAVAVVCAGREGRFALEDAACAGALVGSLGDRGHALELNDAAAAARRLAEGTAPEALIAATAAGRSLVEIGRGEDLAFCAQVDRTGIVPRLRGRRIIVE